MRASSSDWSWRVAACSRLSVLRKSSLPRCWASLIPAGVLRFGMGSLLAVMRVP
jgi:hypothetical protein